MNGDVCIKIDDLKRTFLLLEKINDFFHQPMNFSNVDSFASENYSEINYVYYKILYDLLPPELKKEIENR